MIRKIVQIDEEKCDGCALCVTSCAEGAIAVIDGKARLVSDQYCDGLGACLGECPQNAISIIEREAAVFDEAAVENHLAARKAVAAPAAHAHAPAGGCPGSRMMFMDQAPAASSSHSEAHGEESHASALRQWPIQLHLLPVKAPIFENRELLIAADCTAFAMGGFHRQMLEGRALAIACPKLDDSAAYVEKLAAIIASNTIRRIHVAIMEVPCCGGLAMLVKDALAQSGKDIPLNIEVVRIPGR